MTYFSPAASSRSAPGGLTALASALLVSFSPAVWAQTGSDAPSLGTVVVTASGHEQNLADAPASISVITRAELEKQSFTDIADAVRNIPGVLVTGGGSAQDISIRGMSPSYTLFLVDGRPVSAGRSVNTNGQDGGRQIGLPPLAMIERIEVIRGPMSSLYGSDAMGGVINVITRKVTDAWHGQVSGEYTLSRNDVSNDGKALNFFLGGPVKSGVLGLKLNGGYTAFDESDYVGGTDGAASRPESTRKQIGAELVLTPDRDNTFGLSVQTAQQKSTNTPGKSVAAGGVESFYRYDKDVYALTHEGRYGNLLLNSFVQHDVSDKVQEQTKQETVTTLNSQGTYFWGEHVVTFGGQYKTEELINETNGLWTSNVPGAVRSADRWLAAVFAEVDWKMTDKLSTTTGMRYNKDQFFGGHLSPRVYSVYRHSPQWIFKGGVSTGYKQPSLAQATAGIGSTTGGSTAGVSPPLPHSRALILGNPNLKPESSTSYELGTAFASADNKTNASLMLFHTQFKDKISEVRLCEGATADRNVYANWNCGYGGRNYYFLSTSENVDRAVMQGLEATLDYRFNAAVKISSNYTYTRSEQKSGAFSGQPLNKQPRHMVNALVDWQVTPALGTWLQANYRSKTSDFLSRTSMSQGTPGYGLVDVGLVYRVNKTFRMKAGLYNVANKKVTNDTYGVVLDGRRVTVGATLDF